MCANWSLVKLPPFNEFYNCIYVESDRYIWSRVTGTIFLNAENARNSHAGHLVTGSVCVIVYNIYTCIVRVHIVRVPTILDAATGVSAARNDEQIGLWAFRGFRDRLPVPDGRFGHRPDGSGGAPEWPTGRPRPRMAVRRRRLFDVRAVAGAHGFRGRTRRLQVEKLSSVRVSQSPSIYCMN